MSAAPKKKGPEALERLPSRVLNKSRKGKAMNKATSTTAGVPGRAAALAQVTYSCCTEASNIVDLLNFIARTAKTCAYNSNTEEYLRFHEIRMMIEGAGRMLNDHVEVLDGLSIDVGALGAAEARP